MFIVYDKTGFCHYWLFNFQSPLICVFNAPPVLWHMFSVSAWVKSSQKGWEIGFPFAGCGNDDKVPLLLSSINFVISHSSFFIPRWKSPLRTQFRFLTFSILSLLQGILLVLINIFCAHSRFFCDSPPQLTTVKALQVSADLMRARLLRSGIGALGSLLIGLWPYPLYPALLTLDEYAPWSRPSNGIPWRPYLV